MSWDNKIPFDKNGNLMHYADNNWDKADTWKNNYTFKDILHIKDYVRGRSAAYIYLISKDKKGYPMFLKDFFEMIPKVIIKNGTIYGKWTFCKRGQNFGIKWQQSRAFVLNVFQRNFTN